jgi:hypothetical protein
MKHQAADLTPTDTLSLCVNANSLAEHLEESAEMTRESSMDPSYLNVGARRWTERMARWAHQQRGAAEEIRKLVAEIERLRQGGKPR